MRCAVTIHSLQPGKDCGMCILGVLAFDTIYVITTCGIALLDAYAGMLQAHRAQLRLKSTW